MYEANDNIEAYHQDTLLLLDFCRWSYTLISIFFDPIVNAAHDRVKHFKHAGYYASQIRRQLV